MQMEKQTVHTLMRLQSDLGLLQSDLGLLCLPRFVCPNALNHYLSHRQPAKARASLRIRAVLTEPALFAHIKYESRRRVRPKIKYLSVHKKKSIRPGRLRINGPCMNRSIGGLQTFFIALFLQFQQHRDR